jgi:hypothetical protein
MRWTRMTMMMVATLLTGCGLADTVRSELSTYAEPTGTDVAHIRLIGSRNVKVYPGSTCASNEVPGSGYPAGPQLGGQRKRDLGMPKLASTPKHYVEIAARPLEPLTVGFMVQSDQIIGYAPSRTGTRMLKQTTGCQGLATFVPEVNGQYEVVLNGSPRSCWVTVHALVEQEPSNEWDRNPPRWERQIIPSQPATRCGADDAQPDASDTAESSA